jgi:hypothetical protein
MEEMMIVEMAAEEMEEMEETKDNIFYGRMIRKESILSIINK